MVRLKLATPGLQTYCSSHWTIQLKSYCWEGVEFIQLVYCIIIYLSFLKFDGLLIREVQLAVMDTGTPCTGREIYSEDANGETRTHNPWITNPVL